MALVGFTNTYAAPSFPTGSCAAARAGSSIQCTANDVSLTEVTITNADSCILGDQVTVSFNAAITGGQSKRYDIGVFISNDGNDPTILPSAGGAATCSVFSVANTAENLADGFNNFDNDQCLEAPQGASALADDFTAIQVPCIPGPGGTLQLNTVVTWDNTANNTCNGPDDVFANTGSKCNKQVITSQIPVVALGQVTVRKQTNPDQAPDLFHFTTTGIQAVGTDPGCNPSPPNVPDPTFCPTTPDPFDLADDGVKVLNVGTISQNGTTFTITEDALAGWGLAGLSCTAVGGGSLPAGVFTSNLATRTASLTFDFTTTAADCTFTNAQGGSLTVQKSVIDANPPGGEVAGADYNIRVDCGGTVSTFTLENGGTNPFSSIANGTVCVVSEQSPLPAANSGYSYLTPTVQISPSGGAACAATPAGALACQQFTMTSGGIFTATITNTLQAAPASVSLQKLVTGNQAGYVAASTFGLKIDCTIDAQINGGTQTGNVLPNGSISLNSVTAGATCQAYETSRPAPTPGFSYETPVLQVTGGATGGGCNPTPGDILPGGGCVQFTANPGAAVTATVTNNLIVLPGDVISVTKTVTNKPGSFDANSIFNVTVDCGANFTANLPLKDGDVLPGPNAVPGGTLCVVSEGTLPTPPAGFTYGTPTITITGATQVNCVSTPAGAVACQQFDMTPGAGLNPPPPVAVTVTNPLVANDGGVTITKSATGAGVVAGSQFSLGIDCGAGGTTSGSVTSGNSVSLNAVDAASVCQVFENGPLPAAAPGFSYGTPTIVINGATQAACGGGGPAGNVACQQFTMPPGGSITGTVTNPTTPNPGNVVTISKTVTGDLAGYVAASTFGITVDCNGNTVTANLTNGGSQAGPSNVPAGTQCSATEGSVPAATAGYAYGTPTITITGGTVTPVVCNNAGPCNFTVPPGGSITVAVSNPVAANGGNVTLVSKVLAGAVEGVVPGTQFAITVNCNGNTVAAQLQGGANTQGPQAVPAGTVCVISEGALPSLSANFVFTNEQIGASGATLVACGSPTGVVCRQFTMPAGGSVQVTVTNSIAAVAAPAETIPTLGRYELLALMAMLLGLGLVAVPRYLRNRG